MILVDTGPLVALCDARDSLHLTANEQLTQLFPVGLCTCGAVLSECCFQLPHPIQRRRLRTIVEGLPIPSAHGSDDQAFWSDVFDWLTKYSDQEPDWADASIAVLSSYDKRLKVWTYDREFRTTWRRRDGSLIPLAVSA